MANAERGELEVHLGGQSRVLRFRSAEAMLLEDRLGADPLAFIGRGGGQTKFLIDAIIAGLSGDKDNRATPQKVCAWLDDAADLNREHLQRDVLYALARGRSKLEAEKMTKALDEVFGTPQVEAEAGKDR